MYVPWDNGLFFPIRFSIHDLVASSIIFLLIRQGMSPVS